jgi:hypothetical protein
MPLKSAHWVRALIALIVVGFSATPSHSQEPFRVPYGVTTSLQHLPVLVGKESGLF